MARCGAINPNKVEKEKEREREGCDVGGRTRVIEWALNTE